MSHAARPIPAAVASGRLQFIDMLRALASHLLVWHHLAFYGPLADQACPLAPVLLGWLGDPARMVVQGVEPATSSPDGFRDMIRREGERWRKVILDAGVRADAAQ